MGCFYSSLVVSLALDKAGCPVRHMLRVIKAGFTRLAACTDETWADLSPNMARILLDGTNLGIF